MKSHSRPNPQLPARKQTGDSSRSYKRAGTKESFLGPPKKHALIIAIKDYEPVWSKLRWVHDDALKMKDLLCKPSLGFHPDDVTLMMDLPCVAEHLQPTHANIMCQLESFMKDQKPGDTFFIMYAGHCSQQQNLNHTERDDKDEYLIPVDDHPDRPKKIMDDTLYDLLVKPLLPGSKLIAVMDTCHSATLLDLPHDRCNRISKWTSSVRRSIRSVLERVPWLFSEDGPSTSPTATAVGQAIRRSGSTLSQLATPVKRTVKFCSGLCRRSFQGPEKPLALCFSACKDMQEVHDGPTAGQSMSQAFIRALEQDPHPILKDLMRSINTNVKAAEQERRQALRKWKKLERSRKRGGASAVPSAATQVNHPAFQAVEAQLSSLRPLYMSDRLPL